MRLIAHANVLGYAPGDPITIDDDDAAGLAAVEPYILGGHVSTVEEDEVTLSPEETVAALKGDALDQAVRDAGLPVKGKADDKRAALLEVLSAAGDETVDDDGPDTE